MKIGDLFYIQLNNFGTKVLFELKRKSESNKGLELVFSEIEENRKHFTRTYRKIGRQWLIYRPPFTLAHDPPPEFYLEPGTWEKVEKQYIPIKKRNK